MKVADLGQTVAAAAAAEDGAAMARVFSLQASKTRRCVATVVDPSVRGWNC